MVVEREGGLCAQKQSMTRQQRAATKKGAAERKKEEGAGVKGNHEGVARSKEVKACGRERGACAKSEGGFLGLCGGFWLSAVFLRKAEAVMCSYLLGGQCCVRLLFRSGFEFDIVLFVSVCFPVFSFLCASVVLAVDVCAIVLVDCGCGSFL
ncbi:hypothetical protein TRVL_05325 [Trypanosoma vivax]|nr:hypothetical protein TRVL_05325 [Trypanosoma vivax]